MSAESSAAAEKSTRVTFYVKVPHRWRFLHRLLETRILPGGMTAVILAGDEKTAEELDAFLWTFREESFLPHARTGDGWAKGTPVLIADELPPTHDLRADVLVDWSMTAADCPQCSRLVAAFPRLVEIVAADAESAAAGRIRFRKFREMGFAMETHSIDKR